MLERREQFSLPALPKDLFPFVCDYWRVQGFQVSQPVELQMRGEHFRPKLGLRRVCDARLRESGGSTTVEVSFGAEITTEGAVVGAAAAMVFLPIALVGGAFSWAEFDSEATSMLGGFRQYTYAVALALHEKRPAPAPFAVPSRYYDPFDLSPPPAAPAPASLQARPEPAAVATPVSPPAPRPSHPASACAHCGAPVHPVWRACPTCGERTEAGRLK
jgi:hypothetical protein